MFYRADHQVPRLSKHNRAEHTTLVVMQGYALHGFQESQLPAVTEYYTGHTPGFVGFSRCIQKTVNHSRLSLHNAGMYFRVMFLVGFLLFLMALLNLAVAMEDNAGVGTGSAIFSRNVQFTTLTVSDGLSQAAVNSIVQDQEGYLWFATQEGLNRYDGYEFVTYQHDSSDPKSLSHDWVWSLLVDNAGRLWVGTDGGGLSLYEPKTNNFKHFMHRPNDPGSLSNDRVRSIFQDRTGQLWVGTDGGGLNRFDPQTETFIHYRHDPAEPESLSNDKVLAILEDRAGVLWIGTDGGGLSRFDAEREAFIHFRHDPSRPDSLSDDRIRVLFEERNGRFWVGTFAGGVNLFNPADESFKRFRHDPQNPISLSHDEVRDIFQDTDGTLWFATDAGLDEWRPSMQGFLHYTHDSADSSTIASDRVITLYQGRGGVLWVGTYGGISRWNYISDAFTYFRNHSDGAPGLSNNLITGISESPDGLIWVGTYGGGLNRLNPVTGAVTSFQHDPQDESTLSDNRVMTVFADMTGNVWVGTRNKGLNRLDSRSGKLSHFRHDPLDKYSLSADGVACIFGEGDGTLWVGTYGGGLNRLDLLNEKFTSFQHDPSNQSSLSSDRILSIYRDSAGTLWVGTEDGGLNRYNEQDQTFTRFRYDHQNPDSLGSDTAWDMLESQDGTFWIATRDGGLNRWSRQDRLAGRAVFKRYGKADGLFSHTLHSVLEDDEGKLWLSSNRGLSRFEPDTGNIRHFDKMNGLRGDEFNFGARFRSSNGALLFGGTDGLVLFHPRKVRSNPHRPPVAITAYSHMTPVARSHSTDANPVELTLDYRDYSISFEFTALDFTSADKNQYKYLLEGFDENWLDSGRFRRATYTNLPAGRYTFRVKASNNDGVWSQDNAAISLQVTPPPWKTHWAYGGYTFALIGLIGIIVRVQARKFEQETSQRKELEKKVQQRTKELAERNRDLEALTAQLEEASVTDPLTGLHNRRYLHQYIDAEIAGLSRYPVTRQYTNESSPAIDIAPSLSFIMIDLDGFKPINDTYGHHAGDLALMQVRDILRKCCRKSDNIVRWGGDEFFIVGRHANRMGLEKYAERIRAELSDHQYQVGNGHVARLSGSIGLTMFPFTPNKQQQLSWEQVANLADQAAYMAKDNGRNAWVGIYGSRKFSSEDMYERLNTDLAGLVKQGLVEISTSITEPLVFSDRNQEQNA